MIRTTSIGIFFFSLCRMAAQEPSNLNAAAILQGMHKLNVTASVLYVAAHPDDENTRLLAWLANEKKVRTAYLSLTRGDGGQNLIGKEQGEALGVIRTQELLAARRKDGAEQFFTRANDFGFSKNPEETFAFWNKDSILSDVVFTIRKFKPDLIICRFPTTGEGGHGHHTASAILALEAFDAAADPGRFPEQLKHAGTWQAKRILWNTYNFGSNNTTGPDQLQLDAGSYNPLLGKSYGELASESRSMHKSQGFGTARVRGPVKEYFKLLKGEPVEKDIFENVETGWQRFRGGEKIAEMIRYCISRFDANAPQHSVPQLMNIYGALRSLQTEDEHARIWKETKLRECATLILECSGLWAEALSTESSAQNGDKLSINAQIINRSTEPVKVRAIEFTMDADTTLNLALNKNELYTFRHTIQVPPSVSSNPYWLEKPHEQGRYTVEGYQLLGLAENKAPVQVKFILEIGGVELETERPLVYKTVDPVKGELYRPFEILPAASINFTEKSYLFTGKEPKTIFVQVKAHNAPFEGELRITAGKGWKAETPKALINLATKGEETLVPVKIFPGEGRCELEAKLVSGGKTYSQSLQRISYDHIPYQVIMRKAAAAAVKLDVKKEGREIAYIAGAGDDVAACLEQIGYEVTLLSDEMISSGDLNRFKAIVTGVRAYNINERLPLHHEKLMNYVKNGGNLVVQYNTNSRVGPLQARTGPYPFTISRERVTDEKAAVTFNEPSHPVLNFPNKISEKDFDDWVQERGIYFATETDPHYQQVLSMHDAGEKPHNGSLIIAPYGKGNFVYTGLAFFRQLPSGVPGAYRLFANLLSLPQHTPPADESK